MVNCVRVGLIFRRELLDQLRDRRTLAIVVGLPVLLYLLFGFGLSQLNQQTHDESLFVVLLGASGEIGDGLLHEDHFQERWISLNEVAGDIVVISDRSPEQPTAENQQLLARADEVRSLIEISDADPSTLQRESRAFLDQFGVDVLILVTASAPAIAGEGNVQSAPNVKPPTLSVRLLFDARKSSSIQTFQAVQPIFTAWQKQHLDAQLQQAGFPPGHVFTFTPTPVDLSDQGEIVSQFGNIWSLLLPPLLVVMAVIGAFYPAADVCAGELERGTIETLLISPSTRLEIVLGKLGLVVLFSSISTLLNLLALALIGQSALLANLPAELSITLVANHSGAHVIASMLLILLPIVVPISACAFTLTSYAESTKEAQFYLAPLMMVMSLVIGLCALPSVAWTWSASILPIAGAMLLLKEVLIAGWSVEHVVALIPVWSVASGTAAVAVWLSVCRFQRGEIISQEPVLLSIVSRASRELWGSIFLRGKRELESMPLEVRRIRPAPSTSESDSLDPADAA